MAKLSDIAKGILSNTLCISRWHVTSDNLPAVAELIVRDFVRATDQGGGDIGLALTPKGIAYGLRNALCNADREPREISFSPYSLTPLGRDLARRAERL